MPKTERWQWYVEEFSPTEQHHHAIDELYYSGRSEYQQVAVLRSPVFGKMLVLDGDTQSSQADERIYHETLVHPALAGAADRREVLILGGGEGATLREVLRCPDVARCTMVDIDGARRRAFEEVSARMVRRRVRRSARASRSSATRSSFMRERARPLRRHPLRSHRAAGDSPSNPLFNDDGLRADQVAAASTAASTCCRRAPPAFTTRRCTARWRARCAGITRTSFRSIRTCRPSTPSGRFSPAAIAVDLATLDPAHDRRLLRAAARREFLLRRA